VEEGEAVSDLATEEEDSEIATTLWLVPNVPVDVLLRVREAEPEDARGDCVEEEAGLPYPDVIAVLDVVDELEMADAPIELELLAFAVDELELATAVVRVRGEVEEEP